MEKVDIYDENKLRTGRILIRHQERLKPGEYIRGVEAIIINSQNQILISQRAPNKEKYALKWECNGGALSVGEEAEDGLIREIYEELGIKLDINEIVFYKTMKNDYRFKEIFVVRKDVDIKDIRFLDGETIDAKWVDINEFIHMFNLGEMVSNIDFTEKDFEKCLELLDKR